MKKLIPLSLICLLLVGVSNIQAQTAENPWGFTFRFGMASYNGDLGNSTFEYNSDGVNMAYGVGISYFINDAWAFGVNAGFMALEKYNSETDDVFAKRGTSFQANLVNVNALLRWNFVNTFIDGRDSPFNPYITAGVAANFLNHDSSIDSDGNVIAPKDASETFFSIPFGGGIGYAITEDIIFNVQVLYNRTFTDRIDLFPIPGNETKAGVGTQDIDGVDHDDYMTTTVGLTFAFGGPPEEESQYRNNMMESLQNIEDDVSEINDEMDQLIELNEESINALEELQEDLQMSDRQMEELRAKFVRIVNNVQFAFDESYIIEPAQDELASLVDVMQEYSNLEIHLEAYADERGSVEYNMELAQERAQSVKDFLTSRGVSGSRITIDVYGEKKALYEPPSKADAATVWAQNRAVQITLEYNGS